MTRTPPWKGMTVSLVLRYDSPPQLRLMGRLLAVAYTATHQALQSAFQDKKSPSRPRNFRVICEKHSGKVLVKVGFRVVEILVIAMQDEDVVVSELHGSRPSWLSAEITSAIVSSTRSAISSLGSN
jgi:hypothetical protein